MHPETPRTARLPRLPAGGPALASRLLVALAALAVRPAIGAAAPPEERTKPALPACATAPLRSSGPVRYYCDCRDGAAKGCMPGDDANPGTSPDAPRRTVARARDDFNALPPGGTVAFCRGGAFDVGGTVYVQNPACKAGRTCDWRDYTPAWGATARPIFLAGANNFLWMGRADHDEGYRYWNLDVRHTGGAGISFWFSSDLTDVEVCNVAGSGGDAAGVINPYVARLVIRDSQWSSYAKQGFIGGAEDLTIDSNVFTDVGAMRGPQHHAVYLSGGGEPNATPGGWRGERILNNEIRLSSCKGTVIVAHGRHVDTRIENNLIVASNATGGCYGIQATHGGYPYSGWFRNLVVRRNRVTLAGGGQGITANNCADCVITDNAIALTSPSAGWRGIAAPDAPARPGMDPPEQITTRALIQNNSIYLAAEGHGIVVATEGDGHVVENNAVWTANPTCNQITRPTVRNAGNYCRTSGGPQLGAVFVNARDGDLRPVTPGPLVGRGASTHYSPTGLSPRWSPTDAGAPRTPPTDVGAFVR